MQLKEVVNEVHRQSHKRALESGRSASGAAFKIPKVDNPCTEGDSGTLRKRDASTFHEGSDVKKSKQNSTSASASGESDAKKQKTDMPAAGTSGGNHAGEQGTASGSAILLSCSGSEGLNDFDEGLRKCLCKGHLDGCGKMLFKILLGLKEEGIRNEQDLAEYGREFITNDIIGKWQITRVDEIKFKKLRDSIGLPPVNDAQQKADGTTGTAPMEISHHKDEGAHDTGAQADESRIYTNSVESIRIIHRGLFSSRLQRLADLRTALDSLTSKRKILPEEGAHKELPQSLCNCVRVTSEQGVSAVKLKATMQPCSKFCILPTLEGSVIGLDSRGARIIALQQQKRVVSKEKQEVLFIQVFECQFKCGFRGSLRKVVAHEGRCQSKDADSEMVPAAPLATEQTDVMSLDGSNSNPFDVPLWIYYVRRVQYLQQTASSADTPADPSMPSRPSHMRHRCSVCKEPFIFGRMQACSAAAELQCTPATSPQSDEADRLLFSNHRSHSEPCETCGRILTFGLGGVWLPRTTCRHRLCGKRCKAAVLAQAPWSTGGWLLKQNAPTRQRSLEPQKKTVKGYCQQEKAVVKDGAWLDRLSKRIKESREITVFLSSPFQGLLLERAGLVEQQGPSLVALCENKGVRLHFVDLRWGITRTMSEKYQTVKTCLDAIRGSDIFVGFYGQRYGASILDDKSRDWLVPSLELCYNDYPWLVEHAPLADIAVVKEGNTTTKACTKKSVTHLEFECGYNDEHTASQAGRSKVAGGDEDLGGPVVGFAFFRGQEYDNFEMRKDENEAWKYQVENEESGRLLEQLKRDTRIWAERGRGAYFTYGTPEDFVKEASRQLRDVLQKVLPEEKSAQDYTQQNYLRRLKVGYAGWNEQEKKIRDYINGTDSKPLVVTSAPGGGKSALLANAIDQHKGSCIYHFVGANNASRELENLFDGLLQQVEQVLDRKRFLSLRREYEQKPLNERLEWLARELVKGLSINSKHERDKKLVIVIDGVNELSNHAYGDGGKMLPHDLEWLGKLRCGDVQGVRLVISTLGKSPQYWTGRCFDVLKDTCSQVIEIGEVSPEHCEEMIKKILDKSGKLMDRSSNLTVELTCQKTRANPLYISTFIHEMMCFSGFRVAHGVFEQLEALIQYLLQAKDAASLLDFVFRRIVPVQVANDAVSVTTRTVELVDCQQCKNKEKHECTRQHIEPGCIVSLPGETRASIVVRLCSESELEVMDYDLEHPDLDRNGDASRSMYLLSPSLVSRVLKLIWASKEGLLMEEVLDLLNIELKGHLRIEGESFLVEQQHLHPLVAALHRLLSKSGGLINLEHDLVRNAVENRYFAFSSYDAERPHSGRMRTLKPRQRKVAEENCARVHQSMARYFKAKAGQDNISEDLDRLPRATREVMYHESRYSENPAFLVAARIRPFINRERKAHELALAGSSRSEHVEPLTVFPKVERRQMCAQNPQTKQGKVFTLDCCLDGEQSQKDVWRRIEGSDLVEKALDGLNVTLMAYGQTGSGKTYTMFGESSNTGTDLNEKRGLVPRMITELLERLLRKKDFEPGFDSWKMEMSVVEIYNETVRDLMRPEGASVLMSSVFCEDSWTRIDRRGQSFISKVDIKKKEDAMAAIETSYTRRVVEKTAMNEVSSRSHCIISLLVQQMFSYGNTQDDKFQLKARVNLVDLAGSERGRTRKLNENDHRIIIDDREEEAKYINKSLLVLNQVIFKRSEGKRHAPFRESTLTRLLENSLGGNAFTVLMVNLSPSPEDYGETLGALEYAKRAKRIQNKIVQNVGDVGTHSQKYST